MSATWVPTHKHLVYSPLRTVQDAQNEIQHHLVSGPFTLNDGESLRIGDLLRVSQDGNMETVAAPAAAGHLLRYTATDLANGFVPTPSTFTIADTFPLGSIPMATVADTLTALAVGAAGTVLGITAGLPAWQTPSTYLAHTLLDASYHTDTVLGVPVKGDLIVGGDTAQQFWERLARAATGAILQTSATAVVWTPAITTLQVVTSVAGVLTGDPGFLFNASTDTFTLGTGHIYSQGAHGLTLAANDAAGGSSATQHWWFDDNGVTGGRWWVRGSGRFGTTTLDTAQGDLAAGLTTVAQMLYKQNAALLSLYNASGTVSNQISSVAGTATVFNDTGLATDFRIEAVGDSSMFRISGTDALMSVGTSPAAGIKMFVLKSPTDTSGVFQTYRVDTRSAHASNSTATFYAGIAVAIHQVAFNLTGLIGQEIDARTTSGFSAGTLTNVNGLLFNPQHAGAGAVTSWRDISISTPTGAGGGTVGTWTQLNLEDLSGLTITTRIGVRQAGTNAHNRFNGNTCFGADAAPTAGYVADVRGALRYTTFCNGGTVTDAAGAGDLATGLTGAGRLVFDQVNAGVQPELRLYNSEGALSVNWIIADSTAGGIAGEYVFNEGALGGQDLRVEGGSLAYGIFFDASTATENLCLLGAAAPNWQTGDRIVFQGDATTAPTGNPASGFFHWAAAGVPTWRLSSGPVISLSQATGGENVTNSVTNDGSTAGTIPDIVDGVVYAVDYANLRRALYQLARMQKQDHDQLRAMGILT